MRIIKYIFITLILISQLVIAQRTSTYTRYGLGDVYYSYSARSLSLGHTGTAMINSDYIGLLNPASWSNLSKTRIEFSFAYDELRLSNQFESKYYGDGVFKGFTFAFPVSKVYGIVIAMGIVPYTRVNYEVLEKITNETTGNYTSTYQGKGGLSKVLSEVHINCQLILYWVLHWSTILVTLPIIPKSNLKIQLCFRRNMN